MIGLRQASVSSRPQPSSGIESLMVIKAIENARYLTLLEMIYPGVSDGFMLHRKNEFCYDPGSQQMKTREHMYNVNMLNKNFLCNKMITPV